MALSEVFTPESSKTIERPVRKPASTKIPITARELVEWTYAVQRAQGVPDIYAERQEWSQTGIVIGRLIDFAHLGCRVDVSSNAAAIWGEARCDEDAIIVHEIVERLSPKQRGLLFRHGLLRSAPEWNPMIMPLRCVPVPGRKGKPKGIYSRSNNLVGHEVAYEGDWPDRYTAARARAHWPAGERHLRCAEDVIEYARAVYSDWVEALASLAGWLNLGSRHYCLRRYRVHGLGAEHEPWRACSARDSMTRRFGAS